MWLLIECEDSTTGPGHDETRRILFNDEISVREIAVIGVNVVGIGTEVHPCTPGDDGYHCPICHKDIKPSVKRACKAIFYGDSSRPLWNWINRRNGRTWSLLYSAGVWLQNKEWWLRHR